MDIYGQIKQFKKDLKINYDVLGAIIGKTGEALRKSLSRKSLTDLEIREIESFINATLNMSKDDFNAYIEGQLSGIRTMKINYEQIKENLMSVKSPDETQYILRNGVPFYDLDFTASFLEIENNQSIKPDSYISHPFFKGCDYVVRASGQSMAKVISHGDAIGLTRIENWQDFFPLGEIYAIVTKNGFRMIKVITKGITKDSYTLISKPTDSKKDDFPPQQISKDQIISIFKVQASSHLF